MLPEYRHRVYPTDCDMLGHVNHATMITILEQSRWTLVEGYIDLRNPRDRDVVSVVRHVDIDYRAQALPGDELVVRTGLLSVGRTSYLVRQQVTKAGSGEVVADADIVLVCIGRDNRPVAVPEEWRSIWAQWPEDDREECRPPQGAR